VDHGGETTDQLTSRASANPAEVETFITTARNLADRFLSGSRVYGHHGRGQAGVPVQSPMRFFGFDKLRWDRRVKIFTLVAILSGERIVLRAHCTKSRRAMPDDEAQQRQQLQKHEASLVARWAYINATRGECTKIQLCHLALDMILYLVAHFATLSYVNIDTSLAGDQIRITRFMGFQFFEAVMLTYRSGSNEMVLMIIFSSGVWPYLKILTSMSLWFAQIRARPATDRRFPLARRVDQTHLLTLP
jgi:hypothetical protein